MDTTHAKLLAKAGISQADLARRCGMSKAGIRKCLLGNRIPHNPLVAQPYCAALGIEAAPAQPEAQP
jgi:transcriptional regulator with XRE-family HTH domain